MMWWIWACATEPADTSVESYAVPELQENGCGTGQGSGLPIGDIECNNGRCTIAPGEFWMGSSDVDAECPVRKVELSEFQIDQYEVTLSEWQRCVDQGRCASLPAHCLNTLYSRPDYSVDFPAICVTWSQANNYCRGIGGRLPTEAEWEKAASGTEGAKWAWGASAPDCDDANFRLASIYCSPGVRSVGWYTQSVSPFGLYDVNGNVFEWTADWYDATFYEAATNINPIKESGLCVSSVGAEPQDCGERVLRGGAYNATESTIRNAARSFADPTLVDVNIGFRCAYDGN